MGDDIAGLKAAKAKLFSLQAETGAFAGEVRNGDLALPDYNGFVTALVLREMEGFADAECDGVVRRALDFLEDCISPESGMCTFWPPERCPEWVPYNPEDCDSTVVIAAELFQFGRLTDGVGVRRTLDALSGFQVRGGGFRAWRTDGVVANRVDLVITVNVIAFLAQTGYRDSAMYGNACREVNEMVAASEGDPGQLDRLTPYYPDVLEVMLAFENAMLRGARDLSAAAARFLPLFAASGDRTGTLIANEGRRTRWFSEAVEVARTIRRGAA